MAAVAAGPGADTLEDQLDAAMAASRVFAGLVADAMDEIEPVVSIRQFRALVIVASHAPMNLQSLADRLQVHPSNATRLCDRLVEAGLLQREQAAHDRRHLVLTASADGIRLVNGVLARRRAALRTLLLALPEAERVTVARSLRALAGVAGER